MRVGTQAPGIVSLTMVCILAELLCAYEALVDVRECAGVARVNEPVIMQAGDLVRLWGSRVDARNVRVADESQKIIPVQVDERDGGFGYTTTPNGKLDANDEVVWQATVPALGTRRFRVFADAAGSPLPLPESSDLTVGPNPSPDLYSATHVMQNGSMEIGVRGWPADPKKWSGAGAGAITLFKLEGRDQIAQGEGHLFILNNGDIFDQLYDTLEVVARGPVRVVLQTSGPRFSGRRQGKWGRNFYAITNGEAVRTYSLYAGIPWLEVCERIRADSILPRLTADYRFHWRPGGFPFNKDSRMLIPSEDGAVGTYTYTGQKYGDYRSMIPEPWVVTTRPDGKLVPALFFDTHHTWRFWAHIVEPWMKKGFDDAQKFDHVKCVVDCAFYDKNAAEKRSAEWSWAVWGTQLQDAGEIQRQYRARMLRPLRASLKVTGPVPWGKKAQSAELTDALRMPSTAISELTRDLKVQTARMEMLIRFEKRYSSTAPASVALVKEKVTAECSRTQRLFDALTKRWNSLDNKAKYDTLEELRARQGQKPDLSLAMQQFEFYCSGGAGAGYRVLVSNNCQKVFRTLRSPGVLNGRISMQVSRREGESVQLAIVPLLQPLKNVRVTPSDLRGTVGTLPSSTWRLYEVGDVKPPQGVNKEYGFPENTRWPDPLLPFAPLDCPLDEARAILLTLDTTVNAPPGTYAGAVTVSPEGLPSTVLRVDVRVENVTLPERRTMFWDCWYDMDTIVRHYGEYGDINHFTRNMEMLAKYRSVPGLYGWAYMGREFLSVWQEKDGTLTFDFSRLDPWLTAQQRYGNLWNPNLSCNSGWFSIFHDQGLGGLVKDRTTGRTLTLADLPEKSAVDPEYTLIYEKFMQAYVQHLKEKGWLATAWLEKWDEPVGERVEMCKRHYAYLMKIVPELRLFNWGMRPVTDAWGWGYTHAWAPNISSWYEEQQGIERARKEGVKVFAYTCGAGYMYPDRSIMIPDINIWDHNIQRRAYAWLYNKFGFDGMLIFMMNGWPQQSKQWSRNKETRWPKGDWVVEAGTTYWLVYPGPEGDMLPSLRLDALRDGMEDYEYLHAAKLKLKKSPNPAMRRIVDGNDGMVTTTEVYEQDVRKYDERKSALLRFLAPQR